MDTDSTFYSYLPRVSSTLYQYKYKHKSYTFYENNRLVNYSELIRKINEKSPSKNVKETAETITKTYFCDKKDTLTYKVILGRKQKNY